MPVKRERIINEFLKLTAIDSVSFKERRMADYLLERLRGLGLEPTEDDAGNETGGDTGNIFCRIDGDAAADSLLFVAHMDTVEPGIGKKAVLHDDRFGTITSDGSTVLGADDTTALAEIMEALTVLREEGIAHRPLEILFSSAEESYTAGSSQFDFSKIRSKEAYVLDASGDQGTVSLTEPTLISFDIRIQGRAAHAGFEPEAGISALSAAAAAISKLPEGRVDEDTTFNIGMISGGSSINTIPEKAEIKGEIRSLVHEKALLLLKQMKTVFRTEAEIRGASADIKSRIRLEAYRVKPDEPVLAAYREACANLGIRVKPLINFGGSDGNVLRRNGISGLTIANGMHRAHTCSEYTSAEELRTAAEILIKLMTDGCR